MNCQFALIGYPIKHSLSPWIHEQFLKKAGLDGTYSIMEINPDDSFQKKIQALKASPITGFNVTVPFKQKIIPYIDELDDNAKRIGAVNTVARKKGKWIGYNTDGKGYVRSLKSHYPDSFSNKQSRIVIIGAGGAARGIYDALVTEGFQSVDLANRTLARASEIAKLKQKHTRTNVLTLHELQQHLDDYDVIIQTTSVGMKPNEKSVIISMEDVKQGSIASDIVYQPIHTKFLALAEQAGSRIHHGHSMLLYQAQYAFEIWTGKQVDPSGMEDQLQKILEGR